MKVSGLDVHKDNIFCDYSQWEEDGRSKRIPNIYPFNQGDGCIFTQRGVPEGSDGKHTEDNFISELNLAEEISL